MTPAKKKKKPKKPPNKQIRDATSAVFVLSSSRSYRKSQQNSRWAEQAMDWAW